MSQEVSNKQISNLLKIGWVIMILLVAIFTTQVLIFTNIPSFPTIKSVKEAKTSNLRTEVLQSIPLVRVYGGFIDAEVTGTVDVLGPVDVDFLGTIDVDVQNTPLKVKIYK